MLFQAAQRITAGAKIIVLGSPTLASPSSRGGLSSSPLAPCSCTSSCSSRAQASRLQAGTTP